MSHEGFVFFGMDCRGNVGCQGSCGPVAQDAADCAADSDRTARRGTDRWSPE